MSEAESPSEDRVINSTKTVVVAEDVHNAIDHISTDRGEPIKNVVDDILRDNDAIQTEIQLRQEIAAANEDG